MLLRRRALTGTVLLLVFLCLCYLSRNRSKSQSGSQGPSAERLLETRRLISALDYAHEDAQRPPPYGQAVVLMGQLPVSDPEVQRYQQVLQQMDFQVHMSRYAETRSFLRRQQVSGWGLLLCLSGAEQSCLRRINFSHLQQHHMVNLLPVLVKAFSDAGGGFCHFLSRSQLTESKLPMRPGSCGSTSWKVLLSQQRSSPVDVLSPTLVAMVNVYVLVTSVSPLTAFLHDVGVAMQSGQQRRGRPVKIREFLLQQLGAPDSHQALRQVKEVLGEVLQAASSSETQEATSRCLLCFQLLTFTILFSGSISPVIVQVDAGLTFSPLSNSSFDRQITRDQILEDVLRFLLAPPTHLSSAAKFGSCRGTRPFCLSQDHFLFLQRFLQQLQTPSAFHLLYPRISSSSSSSSFSAPPSLPDLQQQIARVFLLQKSRDEDLNKSTNQQPGSSKQGNVCVDPHLRQIYTEPPLALTPPFSPRIKEYSAEVTFDLVSVRIRPEPVSSACKVHLDERQGPRMANYPVGLGTSRIRILVMGGPQQQPVVMAIYTLHVLREGRPILPMLGGHVTCSFLQDCGLVVQPSLPCGLQPHTMSPSPAKTCRSGHAPGRWVVPCLSCSDNRTCDWREVAWQPDGCYHPVVRRPLLQDCMTDRKVLFIGDSTNRGMMYFLMERLNSSLEDWGKAHNTLIYRNLNKGRSQVSYSYYPQFWMERSQRPAFKEVLLQLLDRSGPLLNSNLTVLVVGGVQWLKTKHLRTIQEVLDRYRQQKSLRNISVVVKSLGMGFHLPVDGIRSLTLTEIQALFRQNLEILSMAEQLEYEVIDTLSITMGRHKEFLQGRCACHFHEVEKLQRNQSEKTKEPRSGPGESGLTRLSPIPDQLKRSSPPSYHVRGPVNQVYSEILLSRLCPGSKTETHLCAAE
ncbi:cadherin-like and PC-esterase domain-containing protein 1 isoform X1 [Oryzias melastigma]|uniref:cadherin-like and PC-esterase domain-containing protein 1 isoform X1 n=1 Tax=Oryzias melastigma TaxID=30732 RepID=UPI00168CE3D6|nr:cadherin-like and PC-esterase domain-containing protein 1 isoform X1 [Oryzias melastigma]